MEEEVNAFDEDVELLKKFVNENATTVINHFINSDGERESGRIIPQEGSKKNDVCYLAFNSKSRYNKKKDVVFPKVGISSNLAKRKTKLTYKLLCVAMNDKTAKSLIPQDVVQAFMKRLPPYLHIHGSHDEKLKILIRIHLFELILAATTINVTWTIGEQFLYYPVN